MPFTADAYISSDYAGIETSKYKFYYGYERTDDDDNWLFTVTSKETGITIYSNVPPCTDRDKFECGVMLLRGIAEWIEVTGK